ncbi:hypothetical protein ACFL5V_07060 [Fibrobacterota bacterium]
MTFLFASLFLQPQTAPALEFGPGVNLLSRITEDIMSETRIQQHRLEYPGTHFVIDSYNAQVIGQYFYMTPGGNQLFLWPSHPLHGHHTLWVGHLRPKGNSYISGRLGSEVGDPVTQELIDYGRIENRVPMAETRIFLSPWKSLSVWNTFERIDHFSHYRYSFRKENTDAEDRPWSGGNYPPMAIFNVGAGFEQPGLSVTGQWDKLWVWMYSPLSGYWYPWKGNQARAELRFMDILTIHGGWQGLDAVMKSAEDGRWDKWEGEAVIAGNSPMGRGRTNWQLSSGIRYYSVSYDSLLSPVERTSYPVKVQITSTQEYFNSTILAKNSGILHFENNAWLIKGSTSWRENILGVNIMEKCMAYYWDPGILWNPIREKVFPDTSEATIFEPNRHHRGAHLGAGVYEHESAIGWEAYSGVSWEWDVAYFDEVNIISHQRTRLRSGQSAVFHKPLMSTVSTMGFTSNLSPHYVAVIKFRHRRFFEEQDQELDLLPSPYVFTIGVKCKTRTNLHLNALSHYLGPKQVRRWSDDGSLFEVRPHWEHNLSLIQTFLNGKAKLHYTALYAFGEDIREYPNESPYRFRIMAGSEYAF